MKTLELFKEVKELHEWQAKSIEKLLHGKNTLTIASTGGGKSLVFQLAGLELGGTTIVISPLKALMDEQVQYLREKKISAISINSDISFNEQREIMRNLRSIKPSFIYISPERLFNYFFRSALKLSELKISMIVIDEAHCISQWGVDFRPDYGNIMPFIDFVRSLGSQPVILALTATLGSKARQDIKAEFKFNDKDEIISKGIIRKNLNLEFKKVNKDEEKLDIIKDYIEKHALRKVLIYLYSRKKSEELSSMLPGSSYYHAGLSSENKSNIMKKFKAGDIQILFSTTAFGMGINIPDIDGVIHYQIPESVEEYYQHVGRGARNQAFVKECKCLLLWSDTNFNRKAGRIKGDTLTEEDLAEGFKHMGLIGKMGKKSYIRFEEIYKNDGSYGSVRLGLIKRMFEKYNICRTIGDIYGNPLSIVFKKNTDLWDRVLKAIGRRNQYFIAESRTGMLLNQIIDHVYEQELCGNIKTLPATERILFVESFYDELAKEDMEKILEESKSVEAFKLAQLKELENLCTYANPYMYIAKVLGVPYEINKK